MELTAVFDIGKTNKKFYLFDPEYQEVFKEYSRFDEIEDEDGYPADNLQAIEGWLKILFRQILNSQQYDVRAINFSTYGASLVHLGRDGRPLTPLYNYTKPYPREILDAFYRKYGNAISIAAETASPPLQMLNSGLQLFWLKYCRPEVFSQIRYSLHFPQYLSYLFTGLPVSEFTSIGCHTALWDFKKGDYHSWVYEEELDRILAPIVPATYSINTGHEGRKIKVGVGIHDSSAALLPYLRAEKKPFMLISTGTWSISLNPFAESILSEEDLKHDCLNFLRVDGEPVKAARLFLGKEYSTQVEALNGFFGKDGAYHQQLKFDPAIFRKLMAGKALYFHFAHLPERPGQPVQNQLQRFSSFGEAYHQLMIELVDMQVEAARRTLSNGPAQRIYVDGGFADNDIYIKLLSCHFQGCELRTTNSPLGSALGAAMAVSGQEGLPKSFLKKNYAMRKHAPLITGS